MKSLKLERQMHKLRDHHLSSGRGPDIRSMKSFGNVEQRMEHAALQLHPAQCDQHKPWLDEEIYPRLLCKSAEDRLDMFASAVHDALRNNIHKVPVIKLKSKEDTIRKGAINLLVGPVKRHERVSVKVKEYTHEGRSAWPFIQNVRRSICREAPLTSHHRSHRWGTCCVRP